MRSGGDTIASCSIRRKGIYIYINLFIDLFFFVGACLGENGAPKLPFQKSLKLNMIIKASFSWGGHQDTLKTSPVEVFKNMKNQ